MANLPDPPYPWQVFVPRKPVAKATNTAISGFWIYAIREGQKNLDKVLKLSQQNIPQSILRILGRQGIMELKKKRERGVTVSKLWKLVPKQAKKLLRETPIERDD
jgi:site-specific recombinase XerD